MEAYILKGDSKEVAKVIQENRIRVGRGVIEFTPCQPDTAIDNDCIATLREALGTREKDCMEMTSAQTELADISRELVSIAVEAGGQTIPDELSDRLAKFGVIVPKIAETVDNTAENGEKADETVPDSAETPEIGNALDTMDDKHVEVEDMQEVDLDADDKTPVTDDTKDVQEDDAKEAAPSKKASKRTKKSE